MSAVGAAPAAAPAAASSKADVAPAKQTRNSNEATTLKALDKSGHYGNMSSEQQDTLGKFEMQLEKQGLLPDPKLLDQEQRTVYLSRFLRARDWNVENAMTMYRDMVRWRHEVDIDTLMKPVSEGGYDFKERKKVAELGWKMYFHSTDRYHRPIFVQNLANLQVDAVFEHTTPDRIIKFFAVNLEDAVRNKYRICTEQKRQEARANGASEEDVKKIVIDDNFMILNIEGLGMGTFWAFKNKLQQLLAILDANYPELSGRVQIINAPWLFSTVWGYIKPWLPANTAAKIDITGTDYKAALFEHIDPADLPVELGGTCQACKDVPGGCEFSNRGPWQDKGPK